jgi:cell division protein FtsB
LRIQAETQLKDQEARETALNEKIKSLETARGQEEALRDQYQVGKEGEGVITIVDEPASSTSEQDAQKPSLLQRIFWWW